jgi:glycosyltransferase involved in cell wall biosynthesis
MGTIARLCLKAGLKNALSFPTKTICVSRTIKGQLGDPAKSIYIPNGVRDPYFWSHDELDWMKLHGLEPGRYILFVGRLIEDKGCHLLAQAMRGLPAGLKLAIAGDSSFTDDYVARLKQIAGPESVFLGSVYNEKLSALYANCALFVLPSAVEGLPLVIIEAMKHRAPVLVSDIPENMEIIDNEPDGRPVSLSFKTGSIDSLKRSIEFALSHPERLKMLATNAFSYINDSYNWREIVRQTEAVYYEAAGL